MYFFITFLCLRKVKFLCSNLCGSVYSYVLWWEHSHFYSKTNFQLSQDNSAYIYCLSSQVLFQCILHFFGVYIRNFFIKCSDLLFLIYSIANRRSASDSEEIFALSCSADNPALTTPQNSSFFCIFLCTVGTLRRREKWLKFLRFSFISAPQDAIQ